MQQLAGVLGGLSLTEPEWHHCCGASGDAARAPSGTLGSRARPLSTARGARARRPALWLDILRQAPAGPGGHRTDIQCAVSEAASSPASWRSACGSLVAVAPGARPPRGQRSGCPSARVSRGHSYGLRRARLARYDLRPVPRTRSCALGAMTILKHAAHHAVGCRRSQNREL
jgi:hypothetical protein